MLLVNINITAGLVNGSIGKVIDILYDSEKNIPSLPYCLVIEFSDDTGPPFFTKEGQSKWVPILHDTFKWRGHSEADHFRNQFPICLSWGLTVWKSQGLTIRGLVAVSLGESEKEHGISYVALSRATDISNVYLGHGFSLDRLTIKISQGNKFKERIIEDGRLDILKDIIKLLFYFASMF
jgi:ATP-dependent exoDNAse (exonuclease V) alpha subunit